MKKNIHAGHRDRMRERFDEVGFRGWSDHEILEYMLYGIQPRVNTNPIAHRLLSANGNSIVRLLKNSEDSAEFLTSIRGVNYKTVAHLRSLKAFIEYYRDKQIKEEPVILTADNMEDYIRTIDFPEDREDMIVLCLTGNLRLKCIANVAEYSGADFATADINRIIQVALSTKAENLILVHNHPSGTGEISPEDINTTIHIQNVLDKYELFLVDHFIVCGDEVISIKIDHEEKMLNILKGGHSNG